MSARSTVDRRAADARPTIVHWTDARTEGGAERLMIALASALDAERWRAVVVVHDHPDLEPLIHRATESGLEIRVVPRPRAPWAVDVIAPLAREFRRLRPAAVHVHRSWAPAGVSGILAARLAGVRWLVATEHLWLPTTPRRVRLGRRLVDRLVARHIAVSEHVAGALRGPLGVPPGRVRVVHNGVDAAAFDRPPDAALRAAIAGGATGDPGDPARQIVLVAARLEPQKGHDVLLRALSRLQDVVLAVAGDGRERRRLERLARELAIADRVRFLGQRDDVPALLAVADVVALPSATEGLPLVALEALAAGRPLVATAAGGTPELGGLGADITLVPPGDDRALAAALGAALAGSGDRRAAGASRQLVRDRFSVAAMARGVEAVYDELARHRPAPRPGTAATGGPGSGAEHERNRILRRVDWRFLVRDDGRFRRAALAGVDADLGAAGVRIADIAGPAADAPDGGCDLVIAGASGRVSPSVLRAKLAPDGLLVVERRRAGGGRRAALTGSGAGFLLALVPWPSPQTPQAWLPLVDAGARRRYLLGRAQGGGWARKVRALVRPALFELRVMLGLARGGVDLWAARAESRADAPAPLAPGADPRPSPGRWTWTLLTGGTRTTSKVVGLASKPGEAPGVVVKWARTADARAGLEREAAALASLPSRAPSLVGRIPRLRFADITEHAAAIGLDYLAGARLGRTLDRHAMPRVAALTTRWLVPLVGEPSPSPSLEVSRLVERFRADAASALDPGLLDDALAAAAQLRTVPAAMEHRDFAPWNLLIGPRGDLLALDWESAVLDGVPGLDAWYVLTYLALGCGGVPERRLADAYADLTGERSDLGRVARASLAAYADATGVPHASLPVLRMLTWMAHVPSEARRVAEDLGPAATSAEIAGALRRGTFLRLWTVEARSVLGAS